MCRKLYLLNSFVLVLALVLTNFAQANLIGYWRFDESSGTIAADSAGGNNDGTLIGDDLIWTAGRVAGALSFPGVPDDARVEFPTTGMSARTGTVAMWALLADPQSETEGRYFFGHTTQPQWTNRIQIYMQDTADLDSRLLDIGLGNSHTRDTDIMELPLEEWLHIALTWDAGNYVVYVNGEVVSSGAYAGLSEIHPTANIGNDGSLGPYEGFAGLLDDVRLYDCALNAAEILVAMEGLEKVDMEIGFAAQAPVIDGEVDDIWADASTQYIVPVFVLAPANGRIDTFGSWKALYDFENLYVIVDIIDDILVNDSDSSWQDDSVEFYFDGGNTKDGPPLSGDNRQYTFGWSTEDIQGTNTRTEGVEHAQVDTDTGWRIEIKLPWLSLQDTEAQARDLIGIDCFYNDDDDGGDTLEDQIWTFATDSRAWNNASQWGTAILTVDKRIDVTAPGDLVQGVPNDGLTDDSRNFGWKSWESPEMAIDDDIEMKYLHFKGDFDPDPGTGGAGLQVTPSVGPTIVSGLTFTTANDFPGRDPIAFELSGSNVGIDGPYELIASGDIVDFAQSLAWPRFAMNATPISFNNYKAYAHYQLIFTAIRGPVGGSVNSMQIAEVELLGVPALGGANIILVTEEIDRDSDGLRDDHSLESFLISEGHSVDVRPEYWNVLTPDKIAELNAADLIIVSRLAWSTRYNQGNEATEWNSLTTPLLQMNSHFARNIRWKWVNSGARAPDGTSYIYAEAMDPYHPVFRGVLTAPEPIDRYDGPMYIVEMIDSLVGTGFTAFIDGTDMGNGRLIAKPVGLETGWIAEWDVGVEFFDGAGQYAGGRRMLFCAGTFFDPDRQEVITRAQGELNLTAEGLQMFRNAIEYLLEPEFTDGEPNGRI